jgi:hypothetical protein
MVRRDPAGPGSRGGNWRLDTAADVGDYVADHPDVYGGMRVSGDLVIVSFTSGLDEHLEGLRASVEHPDLVRVEPAEHSVAKLEADLDAIRERLDGDPHHPLLSCWLGHIQLRAPFETLATRLHQEYGSSLEITLGHKLFPPERITDPQPVALPTATITVPGLELTIAMDVARVAAGEGPRGGVIFSNRGHHQIVGMTGAELTGGIRATGEDRMAGDFAGFTFLTGRSITLDTGESTVVPLRVGTASRLPDASYVIPPGRYEVVAAVGYHPSDGPTVPRPVLIARGAWVTIVVPPTDR